MPAKGDAGPCAPALASVASGEVVSIVDPTNAGEPPAT